MKGRSAAHRCALGMILFRAGRHAEAVTQLLQAAKLGLKDDSLILFFTAMTRQRSGKAAEAHAVFTQTVQALEKDPPVNWADRLEQSICRREAQAVLKETVPERRK